MKLKLAVIAGPEGVISNKALSSPESDQVTSSLAV